VHYRRISFLILVILAFSTFSSAQEAASVDQITLKQHLSHRVPPLYPPAAKVALVQGTVDISVLVGVTGKVESMKVVSGPVQLRRAAMDAVKQWTFHPFKRDGEPIRVTGTISLVFNLEDNRIAPEKQ